MLELQYLKATTLVLAKLSRTFLSSHCISVLDRPLTGWSDIMSKDARSVLSAVQFDRVIVFNDHRKLCFKNGTGIEISVSKGKVKLLEAILTPRSTSAA